MTCLRVYGICLILTPVIIPSILGIILLEKIYPKEGT